MFIRRWLVAMTLALTTGVCWPVLSLAQVSPPSACLKTAIYFVNGVTTTLDEARLNAGKLEMEVVTQLGVTLAQTNVCPEFFLNYNPTSGATQDFLEASQQRLGLDPSSFWKGLEGAGLYGPAIIQQALQGPMTSANQIDQATVQRHATAYQAQIATPACRRVLVVPHSQGNLYTNQSYTLVNQSHVSALKIVGVATPASEVKGNGRYRTSTTDVLIGAIRLVLLNTLTSNTNWGTNPLLMSPIYSGGHSFIGYLSFEPSRTDILNDIGLSLTALASVNPC